MSHGQYLLRRLLACVLLLMFGLVPVKAMAATPQLAHGVIVKLKERGPVVSPALQGNPSRWSFDSSTRQHMRLVSAAWRQGVQFDTIKRSAFAAHVLRTKQPLPLAQAEAFAKKLSQDADVEWALPNVIERMSSIAGPIDEYYLYQTWLQARANDKLGVAGFPQAWSRLHDRSQTSALNRVVVAVLDSGVPAGHPDMAGSLLPGYDFVSDELNARDGGGLDGDASDPGNWLSTEDIDANRAYFELCEPHPSTWHGLAIAGMFAATTNNGLGAAGMLWQLPGPYVLPVRVAGACGAEVSDIIEGMLWAAGIAYQGSPSVNLNPAKVLNLSFGGDGNCSDSLAANSPGWVYAKAVQALRRQGVLMVVSAGNGDKTSGIGLAVPTRPANCPGVLAVTGLHREGYKASFANLLVGVPDGLAVMSGDDKDAVFFEDGVFTTSHSGLRGISSGTYAYKSVFGTSFSAPMVAGAAAMMLAVNPDLSVDQLIEGLKLSAYEHLSQGDAILVGLPYNLPLCDASTEQTRDQCFCTEQTCGAGILNALGAIDYALSTDGNRTPPTGEAATFFTPDRQAVPPPRANSGGGAFDLASLVFISMLLGLTLLAGGKR